MQHAAWGSVPVMFALRRMVRVGLSGSSVVMVSVGMAGPGFEVLRTMVWVLDWAGDTAAIEWAEAAGNQRRARGRGWN